jgi:hypothetical protein
MSRDLVLDVIARKNSKDLSTLADEFDRLAKQTDDAGRKMHQTGTFSQYLDDQLAKTKVKVKELGQEFERTGDKDVFAKLRGADRNLKSLEGIKKDLTKALEMGAKEAEKGIADALSQVGPQFSKTFWGAVSSLPPQVQAVVAAGVVGAVGASSVFIGAAISGAILAGVGAVGIGAAIAGQMHDPRIETAFGDLGAHLKESLTGASASFGPVLLHGIEKFDATASRAIGQLEPAFRKLAPYAERLFDGFGGFVENMLPGFAKAMDAGGKILARIGDDLPGLGNAFGEFFDMVSQGASGAGDAIHDLIVITEATLLALGAGLRGLSQGFSFLEILGDAATGNFGDMAMKIMELKTGADQAGGPVFDLGHDIAGVGDAANGTAKYLSDLNDELDKTFRKHMDADGAALRYKESLTALDQSIKDNGKHWDDNTQAGQRNWDALNAAIEAAERKRQADVANGRDAIDAARAFNTEAEKAYAIAAGADAAKGKLDKMRGTYFVDIRAVVNQVSAAVKASNVDRSIERLTGHASGGFMWPGEFARINEQGREYISYPDVGQGPAYVTPNSAINGAANSGGGGSQEITLNLNLSLNGNQVRELLVNFGRSRGFRTIDELLPMGSAR